MQTDEELQGTNGNFLLGLCFYVVEEEQANSDDLIQITNKDLLQRTCD